MKLKSLILGAAASAVALAPVTASAVVAPRAAAPIEGESQFGGEQGVLLGLLGAAALVALIVVVADGDDDPVSA